MDAPAMIETVCDNFVGAREPVAAPPSRPTPQGEPVAGVDIDALPFGSEVTVVTRNSTYHLTVADPAARRVLISGGQHFSVPRFGWVRGARNQNGITCLGRIQVGQSMALVAAGQPIVTTHVYSITVTRATPEGENA
jgi:hypothetical protein